MFINGPGQQKHLSPKRSSNANAMQCGDGGNREKTLPVTGGQYLVFDVRPGGVGGVRLSNCQIQVFDVNKQVATI